ncbi:MAG: acyl-CoA/acyl-ACP dehydrogenase [Kiloniellales bacterium]|nr:acyl-CoA/acyl-ACP dehydrogenase [Kiloniellales bacterium]
MDFSLTEEQRQIVNSVERFLERHLPPEEQARRDAQHDPPYHLLKVMADDGLLALPFPQAQGGLGSGWDTVALVQETMGRKGWMAASLFNRAVGFGGMSLMTYGTEAQKAALMPRLIGEGLLFALGLTEPQAGSDAAAVATRARRAGDTWVITGRKSWISDAAEADFIVTVVRTGESGSGHEGLSILLVPKDTAGVSFSQLPKVGNNALPSYEIAFDGAEVPAEALMGEEGKGFVHLMSTLHYARAGMAAAVTGAAQRAVDLTLAHVTEREQFGRPIGKFQVIQHRLADMQMRVDQSRLTSWHLAWLIREGLPARRHAAQAKVIATEALQYVTQHGMQTLASAGYIIESEMQRLWRDARLYSFGEGSNEIQRNIIARELGL